MSFSEAVSKEHVIRDCVITLEQISYQVAELTKIKQELEARLSALLEHFDDGSKTYHFQKWKITVKSGYIYTLNTDEYECIGNLLPKRFDPVEKVTKYQLNKQIIRDAERYCSEGELELFNSLISKKPSKLHVRISPGS